MKCLPRKEEFLKPLWVFFSLHIFVSLSKILKASKWVSVKASKWVSVIVEVKSRPKKSVNDKDIQWLQVSSNVQM